MNPNDLHLLPEILSETPDGDDIEDIVPCSENIGLIDLIDLKGTEMPSISGNSPP